ncbi:MAG: RNA polymerase sigma factor [Lachnospiraceae bacterium]|nr:RNA polymerase sigma factor [Lachnospiraceae bacterium]
MYQESLCTEDWKRKTIEQYSDMVYRLAFSMMKSKYDADDIHQEVFVQYITKHPVFDSEEHKKAWFLRVTINLCKNWWKSAWHRKVVGILEKKEAIESDNAICKWEEQYPVIQQVKQLPQKYRIVIHLFYYEEMSIEKIAEILKEKPSTVRTQLTRARQKLKAELTSDK